MDGLKHNLLSVSQFTDKGYEVIFKTEQCKIIKKKDKKLALQGVRKGNLFVADLFSASKGEVRYFLHQSFNRGQLALTQKIITPKLQNNELFS